MHLQPVFAEAPVVGGAVAEELFARGVCLPSGQRMTDADVDRTRRTRPRGRWYPQVELRDDSVPAG